MLDLRLEHSENPSSIPSSNLLRRRMFEKGAKEIDEIAVRRSQADSSSSRHKSSDSASVTNSDPEFLRQAARKNSGRNINQEPLIPRMKEAKQEFSQIRKVTTLDSKLEKSSVSKHMDSNKVSQISKTETKPGQLEQLAT